MAIISPKTSLPGSGDYNARASGALSAGKPGTGPQPKGGETTDKRMAPKQPVLAGKAKRPQYL